MAGVGGGVGKVGVSQGLPKGHLCVAPHGARLKGHTRSRDTPSDGGLNWACLVHIWN